MNKKIVLIVKTLSAPFSAFRKKSPLLSFILSRTLTMIVLLFLLGLALFALLDLAPGDVVSQMANQQIMNSSEGGRHGTGSGGATADKSFNQEQLERMRAEFGLDKPFYVQYFKWLDRVLVHHDLGVSLVSRAPVSFLIKNRLWNSVLLGVYFSSKAGTKSDAAITFFALFFHAFPGILLLILLQLFASITGLFPVTAYPDFSFSQAPAKFVLSYMYHIFLPLLSAFLGGVGGTLRMIRATMLDQLGMPYIFALRARGISERRVFLNHAFINTLNPYITGSANLLASLFSGSLVLEIIFAYPGIGRLMYEAVLQEDINLVLANSMFISALVLVGMLISDILLAVIDPRIRYGKE